MSWGDVGPASLDEGELRAVVVDGLRVCLARSAADWFAFESWCTHEECPLDDGWLEGEAVRCPCHGALFALRTGEPLEGPARTALNVFRTRVAAGRLEADLPSGMLPE